MEALPAADEADVSKVAETLRAIMTGDMKWSASARPIQCGG
jgi:hypothetical protein